MGDREREEEEEEEFVYRISTASEWQEWQKSGFLSGEELDKSSGFIHLSNLNQVQSTLNNFFLNTDQILYLIQIHTNKLGGGLVYEAVEGTENRFPHFYGPCLSFSPIPFEAVSKAEKLILSDARFTCNLLH